MKYSEFIRENYEMLLGIVDHMHIGVWITDGEGQVLMVNNESVKTGGLKRDEVIGRNMRELIEMGYIMESSALKAISSKREESVV